MKFYVPEIGDEIRLLSDWHFNLYAEQRNESLGMFFNHYFSYFSGWVNPDELPQLRDPDYDVDYPSYSNVRYHEYSYKDLDAAQRKAEQDCPEFVQYQRDKKEWMERSKDLGLSELSVCIPKGSVLKIDRIYIRKGLKDFSSITFNAIGMGEVNVKRMFTYAGKPTRKVKTLRFWAKLNDCNNIEFEKID